MLREKNNTNQKNVGQLSPVYSMLKDAVNLPRQLSTLILLYGLLYARNTYWVIDIFCDPSLWLTDTGGGS